MASDLEQLLDMGFPEDRAKLALKKSGNLTDAIDWIERNQDKDMEELQAQDDADETNPSIEPGPLKEGEVAHSLICNVCKKKFRSHAQAEFHATKTEHVDFSESTEEIAPRTQEELAASLADLRAKAAERMAARSVEDKLAQKRNEEIRRKATKETADLKEELRKREQIKEAEAKRREKLADMEAKKRIQAKIQADKDERKRKAEMEKAARPGQTLPPAAEPPSASSAPNGPVTSKPASAHTEARLRLQTANGTVMKTFPAETTLFEVAHALHQENGFSAASFSTTFPRKTYDTTDFGMTLKEAGLVPSAALIVK